MLQDLPGTPLRILPGIPPRITSKIYPGFSSGIQIYVLGFSPRFLLGSISGFFLRFYPGLLQWDFTGFLWNLFHASFCDFFRDLSQNPSKNCTKMSLYFFFSEFQQGLLRRFISRLLHCFLSGFLLVKHLRINSGILP